MRINLLNTPRTRRHKLEGMQVNLLGKKSGIIYFTVDLNGEQNAYSVNEDSLKKHAELFDSSFLPTISNENLLLISDSLILF